MVSFVPRACQINATRNRIRIKLVSYHRRKQLLILEFKKYFFLQHIRMSSPKEIEKERIKEIAREELKN